MPSMEITTVVGCTLMCTFCPQMELRSAYGKAATRNLSLDDYMVLLGKIPKGVRIDFSGMAEPWLNDQATDMLEHTLRNGYQVAIYTTLEGMSTSDAETTLALIRQHPNQVEVLCLHLPDAQENMRGWRVKDEYRAVLREFLAARANLPVGEFQVMTMADGGEFHQDIEDLLPAKANPFRGHSRAGSLTDREIEPPVTPEHTEPVNCRSTPYYDRNVLLPNGDVVLCCMDYNLKHILGNLHDLNYYELFMSDTLRKLVVINQKPEFSKCSICKSCDNVLTESQYMKAGQTPGLRSLIKGRVSGLLR